MEILKKQNNDELKNEVAGRLDTSTAPELEEYVRESIDDVTSLVFDFEKLDYISSAGLRVILSTQKIMSAKGTLKVKNMNNTVKEIFDVTGFSEIITIE